MGIIRTLPPSVVNQIAAGEVVERPASVVKELLENALDAGATRVELAVERGGRDLVRIADDGKGMAPEDLPLAFQPHATSKLIDAEDLARVRTLGFRGEALAAIAEVSKVRCQTRASDAATGSEIVIEGGVAGPVRDCGCPPGTVMEVRNLFYNVPVRRAFLKSDQTEAGHVADAFQRIALAHPNVHLTYKSGGKVVHDLTPTTDVKTRIATFFGEELSDALLWVESQVQGARVSGYVANPSQSRSNSKAQFLFLGGRYVRDRALSHALGEAFRGLLMVGRSPVAFLYLDLPPEEVDVNVHPTKIEVRFRDGHKIYSQLLATVRQTFLGSDLHARLQVPVEESAPAIAARPDAPSTPASTSPFTLSTTAPNRQDIAGWFGLPTSKPPAPASPPSAGFTRPGPPDWSDRLPPIAATAGLAFNEFEDAPAPASPAPTLEAPSRPRHEGEAPKAIQVHDSYLIAETDEGVLVIDQHALHERILFEELRARVEREGIESQRLLVPVPVDLGPAEAAEVLERRPLLQSLGLGVEPFGGDTVLVTSVPILLRNQAPEDLVRDLADHFRTEPLPPTADAVLMGVMSLIACKAAIKAGQRLSDTEIDALLARRHLVANTHHCPHGRPTVLTFTKAELERQFGRT